MTTATFSIRRGDGKAADCRLRHRGSEGMVVLDAVHQIQAESAPISPAAGTAKPANAARARPK